MKVHFSLLPVGRRLKRVIVDDGDILLEHQKGQSGVLQALTKPELYPHSISVEIVVEESDYAFRFHTGEYTYSVLKSASSEETVEQRLERCYRQLHRNRLGARPLYLRVVPITVSNDDKLMVDGMGKPVEYAVVNKQFDPTDILKPESLRTRDCVELVAEVMAAYHSECRVSQEGSRLNLAENFLTLKGASKALELVQSWWTSNEARVTEIRAWRRSEGWLRECHGDLNVEKLLASAETLYLIEASGQELARLDVMEELGHLLASLENSPRESSSWRLLNRYLEITQDYSGLLLMRMSLVSRLLMGSEKLSMVLRKAREWIEIPEAKLILMRGLPGSGKSFLSTSLVGTPWLLRLAGESRGRLREQASDCLAAGFSVVVDADFLRPESMDSFRQLAEELEVDFKVVEIEAAESILRERLQANSSPASLDLLTLKLRTYRPLQESYSVVLSNEDETALPQLRRILD